MLSSRGRETWRSKSNKSRQPSAEGDTVPAGCASPLASTADGPEPTAVAEQLDALEAELSGLKLGALTKRAAATECVDEGAAEAALDDDDDPKAALIKLLLAHAEQA